MLRCWFTCSSFFFFNDTATTEIYTLSLHDALPISCQKAEQQQTQTPAADTSKMMMADTSHMMMADTTHKMAAIIMRSEEHTSELQSRLHLVCRLLLEKKKKLSTPPRDSAS